MSRSSLALSPPVSATLTGASARELAVDGGQAEADQPQGTRAAG